MKKYFTLTIFLFLTVSIWGQETGELRFNQDKERIELYIDEITDTFVWGDSAIVKGMKGWYSVDSLYKEYGTSIMTTWGVISIGTIINERERFNLYLQEWFHKNLEKSNAISYRPLPTEPYTKPLTQNETLKQDLLTILHDVWKEYKRECETPKRIKIDFSGYSYWGSNTKTGIDSFWVGRYYEYYDNATHKAWYYETTTKDPNNLTEFFEFLEKKIR